MPRLEPWNWTGFRQSAADSSQRPTTVAGHQIEGRGERQHRDCSVVPRPHDDPITRSSQPEPAAADRLSWLAPPLPPSSPFPRISRIRPRSGQESPDPALAELRALQPRSGHTYPPGPLQPRRQEPLPAPPFCQRSQPIGRQALPFRTPAPHPSLPLPSDPPGRWSRAPRSLRPSPSFHWHGEPGSERSGTAGRRTERQPPQQQRNPFGAGLELRLPLLPPSLPKRVVNAERGDAGREVEPSDQKATRLGCSSEEGAACRGPGLCGCSLSARASSLPSRAQALLSSRDTSKTLHPSLQAFA
uniref:Uncharacterized protein n=1 Tax=Sphaerodactylus townsendi TaxID=933632 RepID=A0ACB8FPV4_9SAUR